MKGRDAHDSSGAPLSHEHRELLEHERVVQLLVAVLHCTPHVLVIDCAEKLTPLDWRVLSDLESMAPPCVLIVAARDLQTWCAAGMARMLSRRRRATAAEAHHRGATHTYHIDTAGYCSLEILPLDLSATTKLLGNTRSRETVVLLHEHCGGNPAYLLNLLALARTLVEGRGTWAISRQETPSTPFSDVRPEGSPRSNMPSPTSAWQRSPLPCLDDALLQVISEAPPTSVWKSVLPQLDRLPVTHQTILKIAAAISAGIGARFERNVLVGIYPGSAADVDEAMLSPVCHSTHSSPYINRQMPLF